MGYKLPWAIVLLATLRFASSRELLQTQTPPATFPDLSGFPNSGGQVYVWGRPPFSIPGPTGPNSFPPQPVGGVGGQPKPAPKPVVSPPLGVPTPPLGVPTPPLGVPTPPVKLPMPPVQPVQPPTGKSPGIGAAVNSLGFNLLNELRKRQPGTNVVFSPLSISAAFSLLFFGARGTTRTEIESVFGFQGGVVPGQLRDKAGVFGEGSNQIATIANRAYINQGFEVLAAYRQAVGEENFRSINFGASAVARQEINDWVDSITRGLIMNLLPDGFIKPSTVMILVNAIYFKGMWETAFNKAQTRPRSFRGVSGEVSTDFMNLSNQRFRAKAIAGLESRIIELPYKGDRFSMYILLPNSDNGYASVERRLGEFGSSLFTGLSEQKFDAVSIPKWEFEQTMAGIKEFLQNLGVRVAFTAGADLSGITDKEALAVSDVVHKAKIKVDEEGTEAAAATAIGITRTAAVITQRNLFIADHPFLYFIVDKNDNTIFFQGTQATF